jgi:enoyl-CoA hydratase
VSADGSVRVDYEGAVATITLDREGKLNALDRAMVDQLADACRSVERKAGLRAVILTGVGSRAFCAGGDVKAWSAEAPEDFGRFWVRGGHEAFDGLARLRLPVIAVLNGDALGGGLELAACADVRIAERHARVGFPETGIGIIPGWSGTQRAVRRFGAGVVRRMALFGEIFGAEDALRLGLVDHVVDSGTGLEKAQAMAARAAARGPLATELTKMLINAAEGEESERVLEALAGIAAARSPELREGVAAFREKRQPKFEDRTERDRAADDREGR